MTSRIGCVIVGSMERLSLNLPTDRRRTLRRLAREAGKREAELARDFLIGAIDEAERDEFFRQVAAGMTPALRKRMRALARSVEAIRDGAR